MVAFSCPTATKIVSLCAKPEAGPAAKQLIYRYGTVKKVELEYVATADNGKRFGATVSPATPGASVHQLWFNRGDIRYLLTECVGGSCPHGAGVAVLNPEKVLMSARCVAGDTPSQAFFPRSLIEFGNGADDTRSRTELIVLITPHVMHDQRDARALTQDLREGLMNAALVPQELHRLPPSGSADPGAPARRTIRRPGSSTTA